MVLYKTLITGTNSLNGMANAVDVVEVLTTALNLQIPPINDLHRQGAQMILTVKMTLVFGISFCME
jgi:hypothetical protein